jgi:hypothetical protein
MKRKDFPLKRCLGCKETMRRKRYGKARRLEKPAQYAKRVTCNRRCDALHRARIAAFLFGQAFAQKIVAPHGPEWRVAPCSRCHRLTNLCGRRTRCAYCRVNGGSTSVTYIRGRRGNKQKGISR